MPTRCPACRAEKLLLGTLGDRNGLFFRLSFWKWAKVDAVACLSCGCITPFFDAASLEKARASTGAGMKREVAAGEI